MNTILVIDDESGIRKTLSLVFEDEGYRALCAPDAATGLEILDREDVSLVFLDVLLPGMGGLEALGKIREKHLSAEVIMISGHASVDMAVRAVKNGAFDFLEKPLSVERVLLLCRNALSLRSLREENRVLKKNTGADIIIGASREMEGVRSLVRQAAASDARILITGESGVGKDVAARAVHACSARNGAPFVEVNCAAIPDTLLESELFGHEKGAFTGAVASRAGRFELAHRGTLFLDEIGDMSLAAQAKVLRVIQEGVIERLGGEKSVPVDTRIIAATNKDLEAECAAGRFRQDLFFRLNVIPIHIPPLRAHPSDIPALLAHFFADRRISPPAFDDEAVRLLLDREWSGNIRELRNFVERVVVMMGGKKVSVQTAAELLRRERPKDALSVPNLPPDIINLPYNEAKDVFDERYLSYHYEKSGRIIAKTAEAVGGSVGSLHRKLKNLKII